MYLLSFVTLSAPVYSRGSLKLEYQAYGLGYNKTQQEGHMVQHRRYI